MKQYTTQEFIAGLIAFARELKGLTPKEFAVLLEKETQYVWQIENNAKGVSCPRIDKIIKTLGMTVPEFFALGPAYMAHLEKMKQLQEN